MKIKKFLKIIHSWEYDYVDEYIAAFEEIKKECPGYEKYKVEAAADEFEGDVELEIYGEREETEEEIKEREKLVLHTRVREDKAKIEAVLEVAKHNTELGVEIYEQLRKIVGADKND